MQQYWKSKYLSSETRRHILSLLMSLVQPKCHSSHFTWLKLVTYTVFSKVFASLEKVT